MGRRKWHAPRHGSLRFFKRACTATRSCKKLAPYEVNPFLDLQDSRQEAESRMKDNKRTRSSERGDEQ